jgi:primosomal protein N' (replication factor Y)
MALPPRLRRADAVAGTEADPLLGSSAAGRQALASKRESRALALLRSLDADGPSRRQLLRGTTAQPSPTPLKRGWISPGTAADPAQMAGAPTLTDEQQAALAQLSEGFGRFQPFLLFGVTGSGKTEVYLRLVQQVIASGGQALILVPRSPSRRSSKAGRALSSRAGGQPALGAGRGRRSQGFVQAMEGRADIVLGTRLSVFTPLPRLGLIVVDEEHDASYKQHEGVRYSARDLAIWRARQRSVPIVLGSATPSLESWHAADTGRYRASSSPAARWPRPAQGAAGGRAPRKAPERRLRTPAAGHRGAPAAGRAEPHLPQPAGLRAGAVVPSCGWVSRCPHCTANMVLHLADKRLRCHHCSCEAHPLACPDCGNQDIQPFGRGTQRLEETLAERFPTARVLRVDRDAARTRSSGTRCSTRSATATPTSWSAPR